MPRVAALLMLLLASPMITLTAQAQDGTPLPGFVTPDPAGCLVEPRSIDSLVALLGTPESDASMPEDESVPASEFVAPSGEPADAEVVAGVTATMEELFACSNGGDYLRVFALYSDDFIGQELFLGEVTEQELAFLATPVASPPATRESVAVQGVIALDDGRVGAFVDTRSPDGDATSTFAFFVERHGRYLVDQVIPLDLDDPATPMT